VAREIETRVKRLSFAQGYHPEFLGEYAARQSSKNRLLLFAGFSLLGILVLLHVDFRSMRPVILVALTLPFALIGAFYYLRVVKLMYFDAPVDTAPIRPRGDVHWVMSLNGLAMLVFGIVPGPLMALCLYSIQVSL
jgi:NADH:ubiquinone oxidoreductase subunit 2 (subunit N)